MEGSARTALMRCWCARWAFGLGGGRLCWGGLDRSLSGGCFRGRMSVPAVDSRVSDDARLTGDGGQDIVFYNP